MIDNLLAENRNLNTVYAFIPEQDKNIVLVDGQPLDPRYDLRNHSPDGFNWGYGGSGPAQLALALLADITGDSALAEKWYQPFKWTFVARLEMGARYTIKANVILTSLIFTMNS
jgi:hypothetical protein